MKNILLLTSNKGLLNQLVKEYSLTQVTSLLYSKTEYSFDVLFLENNKIDSTLVLTHFLSCKPEKPDMIIVLNPIQCPDINISLGKIIIAENITEWDKKETRVLPLFIIESDNRFSYIGKGVSGDRECTTKTTLVMQSKFVDCITYPIAKVADFFSLPVLSIGIVSDYCTQNYSKFLQSNIKELSTRLVEFIKPIISNILEG